jgi:hypothetical protein
LRFPVHVAPAEEPAMRHILHAAAPVAALAIAALAALPAHAAGKIEVKFVEPAKFTDAGFSDRETERTTEHLGDAFKRLEAKLPDGQTLHVDVLDVDLAGNTKRLPPQERRVLNGGADWPKIKLRYTLTAEGRTLASGEETLSDLDYMNRTPRVRNSTRPLPYEERMLEDWFARRIAKAQ